MYYIKNIICLYNQVYGNKVILGGSLFWNKYYSVVDKDCMYLNFKLNCIGARIVLSKKRIYTY